MVIIPNNVHQDHYNCQEVPSEPILLLPVSKQSLSILLRTYHKKDSVRGKMAFRRLTENNTLMSSFNTKCDPFVEKGIQYP